MNRSEHACTAVVIKYWWVQKLTHKDARLKYEDKPQSLRTLKIDISPGDKPT